MVYDDSEETVYKFASFVWTVIKIVLTIGLGIGLVFLYELIRG